ncbi:MULTISPECIES: hypothetical protein [unclassified Methylococcus]|uniref:hypothetical protein n=1 Tax=unclassified Methylococcus TaxID=2618889 RepID=UPI003D7C6759
MPKTIISTRADLDAIAGSPEHAEWMTFLAGSLWRLERDDTNQTWVAVEDNSTIERYGFVRADFPDAVPPELPAWEPGVPHVPQTVSRFQAKAALSNAGLLEQVDALMSDPATDPIARLAWLDAQEFHRTSPTVVVMAQALGLDAAALDELFTTAASIIA